MIDETKSSGGEVASGGAVLELGVSRRVQLAMLVNGLPVVQSVIVANQSEETLRDLTLEVRAEPDFAEPLTLRLAEVPPGVRQFLDLIALKLRLGFLESLTERTPGSLCFELKRAEELLSRQEVALELCAKNEWPGLEVFPELLAAFTVPNEPVGLTESRTTSPG